MPKDKHEKKVGDVEHSESKKKMVVVEEVTPEVLQTPEEEAQEVEKPEVEESATLEEREKKTEESETKTHEVSPLPQEIEEDIYLEKEKSSGLMWIIILTALLVGALAGGFITYFSGLSRIDAPQATSTPEATVAPVEASPEPTDTTLKREDLKIQVLNGSGVAGAAGKAKAVLEGLGYKNVEAGNASRQDFATTEISILKAKERYLEMLKKDLSETYTLNEKVGTAATSSKYDVIITLGKK